MTTTPSATPHATLIPVLVYADIAAAQEFLVAAYGFEPGSLHRDDDGNVVHGEVHLDGSTIWLHRVTAEHDLDSPQSHGTTHGGLAITVDDVDAHVARARGAGAVIDSEPETQPYGRREYGARDLEGHRWWFGADVA